MTELFFDGQVVLITGAGGGLGRSYSLLLAKHGARVVVNDTGGNRHGAGTDALAAERVVEQIRRNGGEAVAVSESVEYGDRIVESALDHFGRLDAVINNAGILRDRSFQKLSDEEWDAVYRVHLLGTYKVTSAAWSHLIAKEYGRVVMTTSGSALYGNFGQANYAAAKMGVIGLVTTLAREGEKYGIKVNAISPSAASRMTADVIPDTWQDLLRSEHVSPVVACLVHESCSASGQIFEAGGGWVDRVRLQRSKGVFFDPRQGYTPEQLMDRWNELNDFEDGRSPETLEDITEPLMTNFQQQ